MATIAETANEYVPSETKNISDLDCVSVKCEIEKRTYKEGTQDEFTVNVIIVDEILYRIPNSVISQIKALSEDEYFENFKVLKTGTGMQTKYTVKPIYPKQTEL